MSTRTKLWLHISIAIFSTLVLGLGDYKTLSEIPDIKIVLMVLNALVQGLNAAKAFTDTSSGRNAVRDELFRNNLSTFSTEISSTKKN